MSHSVDKQDKEKLFSILKEQAFFREKIILSSGKESDYYIDARRVTLLSEGVYYAARMIWDFARRRNFDAIGGPTLGADPLLGALNVLAHQDNCCLKTFIIRKAPKAHGKQQQIEGPLLPEGADCLLVDDVATTGKAFLQSLDVLAQAGFKSRTAVCLVDRQEGAKEALAARGCQLISFFTAADFLRDK
ncbi:MAG TPA: orotate phosphoribosyltransferase [Candidatus Omnitrophota bacterium]|nr:orotate phosphoribosyltransferase [Candidatus Omnitrophota bacterium]HPN56057.1 orotate phosphoribosyltransferase [Candidatus Omnitrophota bacterium]